MSALTDYLLLKHAASLQEHKVYPTYEKAESDVTENPGKRLWEFYLKVWRAFWRYLDKQAREHNQMKDASENWNNHRGGVYIKGLS